MAAHKPWKKLAMKLTMAEKGLEYIICPPDVPSMDVWYEAFTCVLATLVTCHYTSNMWSDRFCIHLTYRPNVCGELKVYLDRGSLSTWVTKHGILHKTQLAYFDNDSTLDRPVGCHLLKQATTVTMVGVKDASDYTWNAQHQCTESALYTLGSRGKISPEKRTGCRCHVLSTTTC